MKRRCCEPCRNRNQKLTTEARSSGATTKTLAAEYAEHAEKTKTSPLIHGQPGQVTQMRLINTDKPNSKRKENLREKKKSKVSNSLDEPTAKTFQPQRAQREALENLAKKTRFFISVLTDKANGKLHQP